MTVTSGQAIPPPYRLRLFVAGGTARSRQAIENLRQLVSEHSAVTFDLEVVDIYQQPELAKRDQIIATPTLLKLSPAPVRRIVGDLSDEIRVVRALGLADDARG